MPWFRHPIEYRVIHPDLGGPVRMRLRATVPLELERRPGWWVGVPNAVIDTGASLCTFSAAWARENGFPLPRASSALAATTAAGFRPGRVYDLDLSARFRRMLEHPFSLAVVFSDAHPPTVPPLIGLHNLLNYWRYAFDGASEPPVATMGHMRFDTL